jgi:glutathione synthase/RimK-type ligase-like ATP-grasp enzyme
MKFLIFTEPEDSHAVMIQLVLKEMKHDVRLLFMADQPTRLAHSIYMDNECFSWKSLYNGTFISDKEYDVVWWRRARKPYLPKNLSHPDDYQFAIRENTLFFESLVCNIATNAWWVNPKEAATKAKYKLFQLNIASECGMVIPITLCSNATEDIRAFLLQYKEGVIYKPLSSNMWHEPNQLKIAYTTRMTLSDLSQNSLLQLTPGIFQKEIKKSYELRVTCFGDYLVAAKLNSQDHSEGLIDWRAIPPGKMIIEPYILPPDIADKIRLFMRRMGLVFGALDFIVTHEGEYIFLEVNEQGQFLWIEDYNSEFKMLDIFVQFLINKSVLYHWNPQNRDIHKVSDYINEVASILVEHRQHHVNSDCVY